MEIKDLQAFYTIVEQKGISRAARKLHISQPPLSQRLKNLEDKLGTQLIIRSKGQWQVTSAGQKLYRKVHMILGQLETLGADLLKEAESLVGLVRIGVSPPCLPLLQEQLAGLHRDFPGMSTRLFVMGNHVLELEIQNGSLDFAITLLPVQEPNFTIEQLPRQDFLAVYGKGLKVPRRKVVGVEDLAGHPLLLARRGGGGWEYNLIMHAFQSEGLQPRVLVDSQDTRLLLTLLENGMSAVGILPRLVVGSAGSKLKTRVVGIEKLHFAPVLIRPAEGITTLARMVFDRLAARIRAVGSQAAALGDISGESPDGAPEGPAEGLPDAARDAAPDQDPGGQS
ncbi:LysR family transcriptional regulator [Desulfovibrio sp. OttesenSCG-928-C14]|nr:LysR family transcriptional regulator [Desulfovibrio sp. OttesenSCG-928-C14]